MNRLLQRTTTLAAILALTTAGCGDKTKEAKPEAVSSASPKSSGDAHASSTAKPGPATSVGATPTPPPPSGPAGSGASATVGALKLFSKPTASTTLKLDPTSVSTGDTITVTFGAELKPPEGQRYWITLAKAGSPDSEYGDWHYVADGASSETLKATTEGDYEVRLHDIYPANSFKVMARERISVKCAGGNCGTAPPPPPPPEKPKPTSDGYLADGWPAEIPARGSPAPKLEEWNAVTKEVTVWHSSDLKCETKMVREWLRVSCHKNAYGGPTNVTKGANDGQQAFLFHNSEVASLVVEVIPGKTFVADFSWEQATFQLSLAWPNGGRPQASFYMPGY